MTIDEKLQKVWEEVKATRSELHELNERICGDSMSDPPKPGLVHVVQTHKHEIYGNEAEQRVGIKERQANHAKRIKTLEYRWKLTLASSAAVTSSVILLYTIVKAVVTKQLP